MFITKPLIANYNKKQSHNSIEHSTYIINNQTYTINTTLNTLAIVEPSPSKKRLRAMAVRTTLTVSQTNTKGVASDIRLKENPYSDDINSKVTPTDLMQA